MSDPKEFSDLFKNMRDDLEANPDHESFPGAGDIVLAAMSNSVRFIEADRIMEGIESSEQKELYKIFISILMKQDARLNLIETKLCQLAGEER